MIIQAGNLSRKLLPWKTKHNLEEKIEKRPFLDGNIQRNSW